MAFIVRWQEIRSHRDRVTLLEQAWKDGLPKPQASAFGPMRYSTCATRREAEARRNRLLAQYGDGVACCIIIEQQPPPPASEQLALAIDVPKHRRSKH